MHNVTKAVQDRVTPSSAKTMHMSFDNPARVIINAISLNKDATQVVIAGRNIFKIVSIEEDHFVEKTNLRVGKNINLNFSAADVEWNQKEDHILASAATNGSVVIWNLNKPSKSKQEHVFNEHARAVNRVCFHAMEPHMLLSGDNGGCIKLFDVKRKEVSMSFNSNSESVRDVQFNPHHYFLFAAAYENGNVKIWDMRKPDRCERQFTAHGEPIFTIDWHPEDSNWIGTAGRDCTIKVWDLSKMKSVHIVQTIDPVSRIKWRPQRKYHIASCSLQLDFNINIWDIRRPYIPFAAFTEHKDAAKGLAWKHQDPHVFLSCGRDNTLYQHVFRDAIRPADHIVPAGLDFSLHGAVSFANCDKGTVGSRPSGLTSIFRKTPDRSEQFSQQVTSSLFMADDIEKSINVNLSLDGFVESARGYQLSGRPIEELFDLNANVALSLEKFQVAQTWQILKLLYSNSLTFTPTFGTQQSRSMSLTPQTIEKQDIERLKQNLDNTFPDIQAVGWGGEEGRNHLRLSGGTEDDSDAENSEQENLAEIATGLGNQCSDFFFGDVDVEQLTWNSLQDLTLPSEAFQPRHEILDQSTPPETQLLNGAIDSPPSANESDLNNQHPDQETEIQALIKSLQPITRLPEWKFSDIVLDMLKYYAEQGDIQTSVSMLIVLGERLRGKIDEQTQENWFASYIELLGRYELWSVANKVIKLSGLPQIGMLNQQSTTVHTNCNNCSNKLLQSGWLCQRCKSLTNTCSICHLPVKGLYAWCQGCSHGGHIHHLQEWLLKNSSCPTGCGHLCEYT
ncbi:LOW QUALITY PROTEIN: GATOR2 complex protein WDR24-like [Liolophura sinensis]|uniref:LOW QUALITY PROTEIN: GATOR2 complex protein WDR24-like n=1 Tax=Liolophura sinensis TaxID=3198878 RepID=UPI0031591455